MSTNPASPVVAEEGEPLERPASLTDLFFSLSILALQGFGGVLAVVQRELVEKKRWMTREQFVEDWAVSQILPGPNVVNLVIMIGDRYFGLRGALVALAGIVTFPLLVVLALALVYAHYASSPQVAGALRGMSAVAAGLIAATGLKLMSALRNNAMGMAACVILGALCFIGIAILRLPLAWVLLALGAIGMYLAWRRLSA